MRRREVVRMEYIVVILIMTLLLIVAIKKD